MPVYFITGANRGLGLEFVRQLAPSPGNTIVATTRSMENDLTELRAINGPAQVHIIECDTSDIESIKASASQTRAILSFRGQKIDVVINNAAVNIDSWRDSLNLEPETLIQNFRVNVIGPAKVLQHLHEESLLPAGVRVVNLASDLGSIAETVGAPGNTVRKCCGYSISKAAMNMLSAHQAGDLRERVGLTDAVVVALDPGWVKTRLGGPGARLEPRESIAGMLDVIGGLSDADNGAFFEYNGSKKPW